MAIPWWITGCAVGADDEMDGQWNKYPAWAHFVRCLSDLGTRKSDGRVGISETDLGFLPGMIGRKLSKRNCHEE